MAGGCSNHADLKLTSSKPQATSRRPILPHSHSVDDDTCHGRAPLYFGFVSNGKPSFRTVRLKNLWANNLYLRVHILPRNERKHVQDCGHPDTAYRLSGVRIVPPKDDGTGAGVWTFLTDIFSTDWIFLLAFSCSLDFSY